ncbi:amidase domain-containing protein [Agromyces sp. NPDC049794]|uniref:amidase domain-containing protein n=1 Tax=unclassified Agromyces TaxID=2639701 RepID=UPI0033D09ACC
MADAVGEHSQPPSSAQPRHPRHRAERVRNRRPGVRRSVALGSAAMMVGLGAFGAVAASAEDHRRAVGTTTTAAAPASAAPSTSSAAAADTIDASEVDGAPVVTSDLSVAAAPFTGGTQVTVTGEQLDEVASVVVGGTPATIVAADAGQLTFAVPAVADAALGTAAEVQFADAAGQPVEAEAPATVVAAGTSVVQPLDGALTGASEPEIPTEPRTLTLTYTSDPGIDAQVAYVLTYWSSYNSAVYPVITGYDCANFASQSLLARGWAMDAGWYLDLGTGAMSPSWSSSTALRDYLYTRTDRASELGDAQRDLVKVGDIAQFDWDASGDRDHTAVVTRVEHTVTGTKVWVGGHTKDADYWDVDTALATGGGAVTYFSIR